MLSAVGPRSQGRAGGLFSPSTRPTDVGGGGAFPAPGSAARTPPSVPSSGIIEARNNRGSNVRIPYARLVPLHSREARNAKNPEDNRLVVVKGKGSMEYDGLHTGELAWILGRRFRTPPNGLPGDNTGDGPDKLDDLNDTQRYANQAYSGMGNGVDRMQRLASTSWVEAMTETKLGYATVNLHAINITSGYARAMDSSIHPFVSYLAGSTALHAADVTSAMLLQRNVVGAPPAVSSMANDAANRPRVQGVLVLELGPFLRGFSADTSILNIKPPFKDWDRLQLDAPRNLGSNIACSSIETELRRRNLLDWTPDGVVLSKLESPTDEPHKSIEMDARSAQMFNVVVQGPAISTTWTSDNDDPDRYMLECQPMDKVFVCLVADLSYRLVAAGDVWDKVQEMRTKREDVVIKMQQLNVAVKDYGIDSNEAGDARDDLNTAIRNAETAAGTVVRYSDDSPATLFEERTSEYRTAVDTHRTEVNKGHDGAAIEAAKVDVDSKRKVCDDMKEFPKDRNEAEMAIDNIIRAQARLKDPSDAFASRAVLTNFRMKRLTSSYMANYSHFDPSNTKYRCGLKISPLGNDGEGVAEYIVGGWCVGTVLDSSASRSTVGTLVRTAPTSMAMNVNVNVQWWSGDRLYQHYMDSSGLVRMRGQGPAMDKGIKRTVADADL